jgi:hypothetical protein
METEEALKRLENDDKWPSISKPDLMAKLDGYAEKALINPSEQGLIASILIYQQLAEELLKIVFETSQFLSQVQLLPLQKSVKPLKNKMFGQIIKEFEDTISFPSKAEMIDLADKINKKRIKVAHGLVHSYDLSSLSEDSKEVHEWFFEFFSHFDIAQDWLNSILYSLREKKLDLQNA